MRAFGRVLLAVALGGAVCGGVAAQDTDADRRIAEPDQILGPETTLTARTDLLARMTVDVMINGQGPFPFAVDTGADRTAISASLALAAAFWLFCSNAATLLDTWRAESRITVYFTREASPEDDDEGLGDETSGERNEEPVAAEDEAAARTELP